MGDEEPAFVEPRVDQVEEPLVVAFPGVEEHGHPAAIRGADFIGGELVGGQGGDVPNFTFATLYRLRSWNGTELVECLSGGRALPADLNLAELF